MLVVPASAGFISPEESIVVDWEIVALPRWYDCKLGRIKGQTLAKLVGISKIESGPAVLCSASRLIRSIRRLNRSVIC